MEDNIRQLVSMGYDRTIAENALRATNGNILFAIENINKQKEDKDPQYLQAVTQSMQEFDNKQAFGLGNQEIELSKAIEQSMKDNGIIELDSINPLDRIRKSGTPVGLCNVGNSISLTRLLFQLIYPNLL